MPTRSSSLGNNVSTAVDREIGSQYDNVKTVAENIESVVTVADHIDNVDTVATNIVDVHAVGGSIVDVRTVVANIDNVVAAGQDIANVNTVAANVGNIDTIVADVIPNMTEITNSSANAAIATTKAQEASVSAAAALVSEQNAKASELAAGVSEGNAAASEVVAVTKAGEASASATAARNSELAAAAMLDAFDDRYLGSFTVDPTTDNDGQPLLDGALYFNTSENVLKVYDVGTTTWYTIPQTQLSSLLDVQLTSVATGDMLNWNGTKWVNTSSVREHIADTSNPHSVTKVQVGLGNVDNTADVDKNVLSATKWTTARTISSTGDVTWKTTLNGSVNATGVATLANSGVTAGTYNNSATAVKPLVIDAKGRVTDVGLDVTITPAWSSVTSTPTTISGYGITDAYTKTEVQTVLPKVGFDITNVTPPNQGQMAWNQSERTIDINLGNGVILQTGQEFLVPVRNNTASTITNKTICMVTGSIGNSGRITVAPMNGTIQSNANKVIGIATQDIAAGADGFVTMAGKIRGVDTSTLTEGAPIYVSTSVVGGVTTTVPTSGMRLKIGYVVHSHTSGTVFVRVTILDENLYVQKVASTDNAIVRYNGVNGSVQNSLVTIDDTGLINGQVVNVPTGNISATTVQDAINELDNEKVKKITSVDNQLVRFDGTTGEVQGSGLTVDDYGNIEQLKLAIGNINSPLLDLPLKNSLAMKYGVGSCTFTRASTATYIDRYGMLKTAAIDEARFEKEGYLNEESSTNLLTYSEQFDNAAWVKTNLTVSANTTGTLDPYGTNLADKLVENSTPNVTHLVQQSSITVTAGTSYTFSIFAKAAERGVLQLVPNGSFFSDAYANFDLVNGVTSAFSDCTTSIIKLENGLYRCSITISCTTTGTGAPFLAYIQNSTTAPRAGTYTGDGVSGIFVFGAQIEALPFTTSYIPTTSATVTRASDILYVTRAGNFPNAQNNVDGFTIICDVDSLGEPSSAIYIWGLYNSSTDCLVTFVTNIAFANRIKNSVGTLNNLSAHNGNYKRRLAITQSNSSLKTYLNGINTDTDTNTSGKLGDALNGLTNIRIGGYSNITSSMLCGHISNFRIYDKELTAQEVALA